MLRVHGLSTPSATATRSMTLRFEHRCKSRLRTRLDDGTEVGLLLPRGTRLRSGDKLAAEDGSILEVIAADETLSTVASDDPWLISRAAYHLGNRHVPLQIEPGRLSYEHDHVLDDLVRSLGLQVQVESGPFEPEGGSYGGGSRHRDHDHDHDHDRDHDHDQRDGRS